MKLCHEGNGDPYRPFFGGAFRAGGFAPDDVSGVDRSCGGTFVPSPRV